MSAGPSPNNFFWVGVVLLSKHPWLWWAVGSYDSFLLHAIVLSSLLCPSARRQGASRPGARRQRVLSGGMSVEIWTQKSDGFIEGVRLLFCCRSWCLLIVVAFLLAASWRCLVVCPGALLAALFLCYLVFFISFVRKNYQHFLSFDRVIFIYKMRRKPVSSDNTMTPQSQFVRSDLPQSLIGDLPKGRSHPLKRRS